MDQLVEHFHSSLAFNDSAVKQYLKQGGETTCILPKSLLRHRCEPELIGLGPCHVHAPHVECRGLPLPPCPYGCGWRSVDDGHVSARGSCPARRVYGAAADEWVGGAKLLCATCKAKKDRLKEQLAELKEDEWSTEAEITEAERPLRRWLGCKLCTVC